MKVLILAGGFATRLWPLTEHRAKPMLLVDRQPILGHILDMIPSETEVFLLTNSRFAPDFEAYTKPLKRPISIFCEDAHCDSDKLGALAAVSAAIDHFNIQDDILILAGDNLLPSLSLKDLMPASNEARLALKAVPDLHAARSFGVVELENAPVGTLQKVLSFEEKPAVPKSMLVSTGFMGVGQHLLQQIQRFAKKSPDALGSVITYFLEQDILVRGIEVSGEWFDVGSYEAYLAAHKALQTQPVIAESTAKVTNTRCEGRVYIGAGAQVSNSVLIDAVIYPNCVLDDCQVSQSVLDENCQLKGVDLCRKLIRQGTCLRSE